MLVAKIKNLFYKQVINTSLKDTNFDANVNNWPTASIVTKGNTKYAVSKWVSAKRTRSYPYERVYNTFGFLNGKKVTIIPLVKDEGIKGDKDLLSWSTVALMSLLNIYVIIAYYEDGTKRGNKITKQKYNSEFIKAQFERLDSYQLSSLHWNLHQLEIDNLSNLLDKVISCYEEMGKARNVIFYNSESLKSFKERINKDVNEFKDFSKLKSSQAQLREIATLQPKEILSDGEKMPITINNYLGGLYHFTVDDVKLVDGVYELRECKHSKSSSIPAISDIKDGLLKMIVYSNFDSLELNNEVIKFKPVLRLTSNKCIGKINEASSEKDVNTFIGINKLQRISSFINELVREAKTNNFGLTITHAND